MKSLLVAVMAILLCACGSGQPATAAQPAAVTIAASLPQTDSYTLPASNAPIYAVELWVSGVPGDAITFPAGTMSDDSERYPAAIALANYIPDRGAWYIAIASTNTPIDGTLLFHITSGYHPVQLVRMTDLNGIQIGSARQVF